MTERRSNADGGPDGNKPKVPSPSPWARAEPESLTGEPDTVYADRAEPADEPVVNLAPAVTFFLLLMAGIQAVRSLLLPVATDNEVLYWFAFIPELAAYGLSGLLHELLAAITYSLLHGGWTHFFMNAVWLAIFGSPLALRIGTGPFVLFWIATSFAAALLHFVIDPFGPSILVGASGAISGMMGAASRLGFRIDRSGRRRAFASRPLSFPEVLRSRTVLGFISIWLLVNLITGLFVSVGDSAIAWQAHIGGFIAGFLLLPLFPARR